MTRAIQTAALVFEHALLEGVPMVIRPEIREYFPDSWENAGRPLADVVGNQALQELPAWGVVEAALNDAMASEWAAEWDDSLAKGEGFKVHSMTHGTFSATLQRCRVLRLLFVLNSAVATRR